jgi:hypothetical protein
MNERNNATTADREIINTCLVDESQELVWLRNERLRALVPIRS